MSRFRPKAKKESFVDVSNAPIMKGDILKLLNEETGDIRTFQVQACEDNEEGTARRIQGTLVDTTVITEQIGTDLEFVLPRSQPMMGVLIKVADAFTVLNPAEQNDLIAVELYKFLMGRAAFNYRASWTTTIDWLKKASFIPQDETFDKSKRRVRIVLDQRPVLFRRTGAYIYGTGATMEQGGLKTGPLGGGTYQVKRVNLEKLNLGIRLLLESGLFGEVVIE